jgi:hypothetical protein
MRYALFLIAAAFAWRAAACHGHGNPILVDVPGSVLTVSGGLTDDRGYSSWVFADDNEDAVFSPIPGQQLLATLPGFDITGMSPGQDISLEVLSRPDFTQPTTPKRWLWYWDPTADAVTSVPENPMLEIASARALGPSVFIDQSATPPVTSLLMANLQGGDIGQHVHLLAYVLDDSPPASSGAYGFFARLKSTSFQTSAPFLVTLNYNLDAASFQRGAKRINAAARLPGDYDGDDDADGADFLRWQLTLSSTSALAADASFNDVVDAADLAIWRVNLGRVAPAHVSAVPEGSAIMLLAWGGGILAAYYVKAKRMQSWKTRALTFVGPAIA